MRPKESGAAQVVAYIQGKGEKPTAEKVAEAAETIKALADELAVIWAEARGRAEHSGHHGAGA